jgi:cephalosporin hydroxylase
MSTGLKLMTQKFTEGPYKILEVGTAHGHFLYSMVRYMEMVLDVTVDAYGIDSQLHGYDPFFFRANKNMTFIKGNSTDESVLEAVKDGYHFIFIDACHCWGHVLKDLNEYHNRILPGGFVALHDTHPAFQGGTEQPRTPECSEDVSIGVVRGIEAFDMEKHGFRLVVEDQPVDKAFGGIRVYEKVK